MAAALLSRSRGTLVWVVGAITAGEAVLEAFAALMEGRTDQFALWFRGGFMLLGLALLVETYELPRGAS